MDLMDTCNVCSKTISKQENVVLTMDGHRQDEAVEGQYAEYSLENSAPYSFSDSLNLRGVYCMSCWDEVQSATTTLVFCESKKDKEGKDAAKK